MRLKKERQPLSEFRKFTRYSAAQQYTLWALYNADCSPWHLAGLWYFDVPAKGLERVQRAELAPEQESIIRALYEVSTDESLGHLRHHAALAVSMLLYVVIFPSDRPGGPIWEAVKDSGILGLQPAERGAWLVKISHYASPFRAWTFATSSWDCVRIAMNGPDC